MRTKTVFVVGAGASTEFGRSMPVGSELAERIEEQLNAEYHHNRQGTGAIHDALSQSSRSSDDYVQAAHTIRRSLHGQDSIDDLLNDWSDKPEISEVAKLAIAQIIVVAEANSLLGRFQNVDDLLLKVSALRNTWLGQVARYFKPQFKRRLLGQALNSVGFIVFNYDRCVELFLFAELMAQTDLGEAAARKVLQSIPIIHPYGSLGDIFSSGFAFGDENPQLIEMARKIKTYSEEERDSNSMTRIRSLLAEARRVIMVGFGYHPANMKLLAELDLQNVPEIWGACVNPDASRVQGAKDLIGLKGQFTSANVSCAKFISDNRATVLA